MMAEHIGPLQLEEAEILASLITERLTRAAIEVLKICGVLQEAPRDPDMTPEEAEVLNAAEALLRRHV